MHTIMRVVISVDPVSSSASVVTDAENDQEAVPANKKKCLWDSFDEELKKKKSTHLSTAQDKDEQELSLYCSAEYIDRKEDPLSWWRKNKNRFPTLTKICKGVSGNTSHVNPIRENLFSSWIH